MSEAVGERKGRRRVGRHLDSRVPDGEKRVGKSICMKPQQWARLERMSFAEGKSLSGYLAELAEASLRERS